MLAVGLAVILPEQVLWPSVRAHLGAVREAALLHPAAAMLLHFVLFAAMTLACLPVGPMSALVGGALFGAAWGAAGSIAAAVAGSLLLFLLSRRSVGRLLASRQDALLARLRPTMLGDGFLSDGLWGDGFLGDGFWGVLALRVAPVTPGWLVSVAAGSFGVSTLPFVLASAIGIVPAFGLFARLGAGVGETIRRGETPELETLLRPAELLALVALGVLIGLPVLIRIWRRRRFG